MEQREVREAVKLTAQVFREERAGQEVVQRLQPQRGDGGGAEEKEGPDQGSEKRAGGELGSVHNESER
jgi:hypothetical protein